MALDRGQKRIPLETEALTELGTRLYELIKGTSGYKVAHVGWDVDYQIDIKELIEEWAEEIIDGSIYGLVVSHEVRSLLPQSEYFVPFDDDHDWIPYQGTNASKLLKA